MTELLSSLSSLLIRCGMLLVAALFCPLQAQTAEVKLPEKPPLSFLYQASEGNLFFEKYQVQQLSQELKKFHSETGFAVYVVTVNSPSKEVLSNLQQQIKIYWADHRDCMVIFYDLDTKMLAVQFEQFFYQQDGMMIPSKFSGVSESVWVNYIDQWLDGHEQKTGLDLQKTLPFLQDFLGFMRQELAASKQSMPIPKGIYIGLLGLVMAAFYAYLWFHKYARKSAATVQYYFPALRMNHRLKARFGGGLLSTRHFGPSQSSR